MPEDNVSTSSPASAGGSGGGTPSTPSTPSTPTPAATPATPAAAAPATPVEVPVGASLKEGRPHRNPDEGALDYIKRVREFEAGQKPAEPVVDPTKAVDPAKVADPAKAADPTKVEEPKKEEPKAADEEEEGFLDDDTPLQVREVAEKIASPEAQEALAKLGIDPDALLSTARIAARGSKLLGIFPDEQTATFAKERSDVLYGLEDSFTEIASPQDAMKFVSEQLLPMGYVLNEDGTPMVNEQGQFVTDGSVYKFLDHVAEINLDYDYNYFKALGDEETMAAIDRLRAARKAGGAPGNEETLSEEVKQEKERNRQDREKIQNEKLDHEKSKHEEFETQVRTDTDKGINAAIDKYFEKVGNVSDFVKESVRTKARQELFNRMVADTNYKSQRDNLGRFQRSSGVMQKRVALNLGTAKGMLSTIMRPLLKEAGVEHMTRKQAHLNKTATQMRDNRMEPKGGGTAAMPAAKMDSKDLMQKIKREHPGADNAALLKLWRQQQEQATA